MTDDPNINRAITTSTKDEEHLVDTPNSKAKNNVFKSPPAPSNKKSMFGIYAGTNGNPSFKSPMVNNQAKLGNCGSNSKGNGVGPSSNNATSYAETNSWFISPVCSKLRDHIFMVNGGQKDMLFLHHSPMTAALLGAEGSQGLVP